MHLPGALLAERIGGKVVMIIGLGCTVILTLLTPICVSYGDAYALITIRALIGTFQGGMWPAVSTLLAAWVPSSERGLLASLVFCGLPVSVDCSDHRFGIRFSHTFDRYSAEQSSAIWFLAYYWIPTTIGMWCSTYLDHRGWSWPFFSYALINIGQHESRSFAELMLI